jgi:signal transduction histidine kinase
MKPRLGTTAALAAGITLAVVAACAAGAFLYAQRHYRTLLDSARGSALGQAELIRTALEHEMLTRDRTLIGGMVRAFGAEPGVAGVMLLDRQGVVRYASGGIETGRALDPRSPTCLACHQYPPSQRTSSRMIDDPRGVILRTVVPVRNRDECHACHDPAQRINGIVIYDVDASRIQSTARGDLRWMVGTTGAVALLLLTGVAAQARLMVKRRFQHVERTALAVAGERERLETIINSIDDGIVVLDGQRRVIAANDAFVARTARPRPSLVGCSCGTAGSGMCAMSDCPAVACLETDEPQVRIAERRRPDGTIAWDEVHACRVASAAAGEEVQIVEVWRDISERRAAEARLAESHRLASLGMLASGFSHEMNTPLGTVMTCVDGIARELRRQAVDLARVGEHAAIARDQLLRCRAITQHFLRMSRGGDAPGAVVDLPATLAAVVRLTVPTARAKGVTIEAAGLEGADCRVRADEMDIQHALINVLLNSVQASRDGGTVRVRLERGNPLAVSVTDQGPGIAPEQQARIFEPFFSLRPGGTGLGLFVSLTGVRKWGGDIRLVSAHGHGATFVIELPALDATTGRVAV